MKYVVECQIYVTSPYPRREDAERLARDLNEHRGEFASGCSFGHIVREATRREIKCNRGYSKRETAE